MDSYRELQVESNCLRVLWHRAYSTSLCCIRMLRLSALSLQMASQVAALTLLALPASVAARARSAPSVCGGCVWGGGYLLTPLRCKLLPSVPSKRRSRDGIPAQSRHTPAAFDAFHFDCKLGGGRTCFNVLMR